MLARIVEARRLVAIAVAAADRCMGASRLSVRE